jgi:hypothetical protein
MKKLGLLLLLGLFLAGCGAAASKSEFWQHSAMYKNWDHMKFSMTGYKNPTADTGNSSQSQEWWGEEIPYIPAQ